MHCPRRLTVWSGADGGRLRLEGRLGASKGKAITGWHTVHALTAWAPGKRPQSLELTTRAGTVHTLSAMPEREAALAALASAKASAGPPPPDGLESMLHGELESMLHGAPPEPTVDQRELETLLKSPTDEQRPAHRSGDDEREEDEHRRMSPSLRSAQERSSVTTLKQEIEQRASLEAAQAEAARQQLAQRQAAAAKAVESTRTKRVRGGGGGGGGGGEGGEGEGEGAGQPAQEVRSAQLDRAALNSCCHAS
jgi:hypothetical protein